MNPERILFVTGRLAEFSLRRELSEVSQKTGFEYDVAVLGISVAALMQTDWVRRKLSRPEGFSRVILPGWCRGDTEALADEWGVPVVLGPKDLRDLPEFFGKARSRGADYGRSDIEILAEINHAPWLSDQEILQMSERYRAAGANVIDLGCVPGQSWQRAGEVTRLLCSEGFRVSIDSFERWEVERAVEAGAELVLSCNSSNRDWARSLPAELVAIPDDPRDLESLAETIALLTENGTRFRIDPILEPIGFGFAASLGRYLEVRQRWPEVEILMGVGNLTELTEVDTAGINVLLAGICQEQRIRSILTTEVINWGRSAVREFAIARELVFHSLEKKVLPKHVDSRLVMLRDPKVRELGQEALDQLAESLTDPNYRLFVERGEIHVLSRDGYWRGADPYELFDQLPEVDSSHAFYLGYELCKAVTALTLGKQYQQDEALRWGFLTVPEQSAHERRRQSRAKDREA